MAKPSVKKIKLDLWKWNFSDITNNGILYRWVTRPSGSSVLEIGRRYNDKQATAKACRQRNTALRAAEKRKGAK